MQEKELQPAAAAHQYSLANSKTPTNEPIEHVDDTGPISEYATLAVTGSGPGMEPRNKHEAKASPDWPKWKVAMSEEMTQLHANKT